MKPRVFLNSDRDIPLLHFLWKWKVAPTKALVDRFFYKGTIENGYRRILKLHEGGFIDSRYTRSHVKHAWQLSPDGFRTVLPGLPTLAQEGSKSQYVIHDLIVAAAHLGDWVKANPDNVTLYTEQELQCYIPDEFPSWLPKATEGIPDGYWVINPDADRKLIALEVEITQKNAHRYIGIAGFYGRTEIDSILWIVKNESLAEKISQIIQKTTPARLNAHNFSLVSDFLTKKWDAAIVLGGHSGATIAEYLTSYGAQSGFLGSSYGHPTSEISSFLQLQKSYPKSTASFSLNLGDRFD